MSVYYLHQFNILNLYAIFAISTVEYLIYISMMLVFLRFYCWKSNLRYSLSSFLNVLFIGSYGKLFNMAAAIWCSQDIILSCYVTKLFVFTTTVKALCVYLSSNKASIYLFVLISMFISTILSSIGMHLFILQ